MAKSKKSEWFSKLIKRKYGPSVTWNEYGGKIWIFDAADRQGEPLDYFDNMDEGFKKLIKLQNFY